MAVALGKRCLRKDVTSGAVQLRAVQHTLFNAEGRTHHRILQLVVLDQFLDLPDTEHDLWIIEQLLDGLLAVFPIRRNLVDELLHARPLLFGPGLAVAPRLVTGISLREHIHDMLPKLLLLIRTIMLRRPSMRILGMRILGSSLRSRESPGVIPAGAKRGMLVEQRRGFTVEIVVGCVGVCFLQGQGVGFGPDGGVEAGVIRRRDPLAGFGVGEELVHGGMGDTGQGRGEALNERSLYLTAC